MSAGAAFSRVGAASPATSMLAYFVTRSACVSRAMIDDGQDPGHSAAFVVKGMVPERFEDRTTPLMHRYALRERIFVSALMYDESEDQMHSTDEAHPRHRRNAWVPITSRHKLRVSITTYAAIAPPVILSSYGRH